MTAPLAFPMQNTTYGEEMLFRLLDDLFAAGVRDSAGLAVAQRAGGGANMSVDVAAGEAVVAVSAGGKRVVRTSASTNSGTPGTPTTADNWTQTFIAADATNPRVDRVVIQVRDVDVDAANFSTRDVAWRVIPGTPTAGATLVNLNGAPSVPISSLLLANVLIPNAATSVTTVNIDSTYPTVRGAARIGAGQVPGGTVLIEDKVLGSTATSVIFSAIPQGFRHLVLEWDSLTDNATDVAFQIQINGDATANYDWQELAASVGATSGSNAAAANVARLGVLASSSSGTARSSGVVDFPNYTGSLRKSMIGRGGTMGASSRALANFAQWRSTAAISSITLSTAAGNFVAGSRFTLYGLI